MKKQLLTVLIYEALEDFDTSLALGTTSSRSKVRTLRCFDFDDTLVKTNSRVGVTEFDKLTGEQLKPQYLITPGVYATFKKEVAARHPEITYKYDYSEFQRVVDPKIIERTFEILKKIVNKVRTEEGNPAVILTARGHAARQNILEFLKSMHVNIPVVTLDGSDPALKSEWIKTVMLSKDIPQVEFFDDSRFNIAAVAKLQSDAELLEKFGSRLKVAGRLVKTTS